MAFSFIPFIVDIDMNDHKIINLADGVNPGDAVNLDQLQSLVPVTIYADEVAANGQSHLAGDIVYIENLSGSGWAFWVVLTAGTLGGTATFREVANKVEFDNAHEQNTDTGTTSTTFRIDQDGNYAELNSSLLTANRVMNLPDKAGTFAMLSDIIAETLAATLSAGNTTGGKSIVVSAGDEIQFGAAAENITKGTGTGIDYNATTQHFFKIAALWGMQLASNGNLFIGSLSDGTKQMSFQPDVGQIQMGNGSTVANAVTLATSLITAARTYDFPDKDGTIALVSDTTPNYTWQLVNNTDSPVTAAFYDLIEVDASAGIVTINLPAVSGNANKSIIVKAKDSTNTITIDGNGAETIDGATTKTLTSPDSVTLWCTGSAWIII